MRTKIVSIILAVIMIFSCLPLAYAQGTAPELYTVYGDGMLLEQNKTTFISGTGTPGDEISLTLYDGDTAIFESEAAVNASGEFSVPVNAPAGGYKEYKIVLQVNGNEFKALNNIVFGELWLASGQSNMQYPLGQAKYGLEMCTASQKLSKWLRVLYVPGIPEYNGSAELVPAEPQRNIPGACWLDGENPAIYGISAVAYFFAEELAQNIDVPVGIINVPLGGTTIATWLSREAIESDPVVKNALVSRDTYIDKNSWNESDIYVYHDMAANYNLKMEGIKDFSISGMIWYQGESDIGWNDDEYAAAFDLMQKTYSELFNYQGGLLPVIYTQLASFYYDNDNTNFLNRNIAFTEMQKDEADSRAVVSIYDVPLTYIPAAGSIHPECKKEVGERMAFAAQGLVYNQHSSYSAATVKSAEIKNSSLYVTLNNVGDGLKAKGSVLNGFAVCGDDGIYVQANAEIVSSDTVRVWNDDIKSPVSASYAYYTNNGNANLYATKNGELALPVSIFVTDESVGTHYWIDNPWTNCSTDKIWHIQGDTYSGNYPTWEGKDADISFSNDGLNIKKNSELSKFSVNPILTYEDGIETKSFYDVDCDYTDYGTMSFYVKNSSQNDITLKGVRFYVNAVSWYAPEVDGTRTPQAVIPADGAWHKITLNLNRIYLNGNEGGIGYTNERLDTVREIEFVFDSKSDEDAELTLDNITFTPSSEDVKADFTPEIKNIDNVLELISAIFVNIIGLIVGIFR
ncbi:MAG: hypothetical protein IJZ57_09715 [Clostridia bacterium]|nr:hypothetical protein [Clostridia bacterium]